LEDKDSGPTFIDAFAGCGGLSLGLLRAGWKGLFAIEKDDFAFETLKSNLVDPGSRHRYSWPIWLKQEPSTIEALMADNREKLEGLRGKVDLLAGGPPCQGFSSAGRRKTSDPRNELFERYLEFVELIQPKLVLIENVKGITYDFVSKDGEERRNFAAELIARLGKNYHVYTDTLTSAAFGVPQQRPRFFIVGMLKTEHKKLPKRETPFHLLRAGRVKFLQARNLPSKTTSAQAIGDLETARAGIKPCPDSPGYSAICTAKPLTHYQRYVRNGYEGEIPDTRLAKHRPHIVERFATIIAECKESGRLNVQLNKEMRDRYGIKKMATRVLAPGGAAPTITSMPDDLLHYSEPRTLTVRENARLQTFPDWFAFKGKYTTGGERRAREVPRFTQVANAVPPLIAEMFGEVLMRYARRQWAEDRIAA
jgi:DNA (cytosine-5)-methyltransferase 1